VVATALPPPSGNKLAKPYVSDRNERKSTGVPAARVPLRTDAVVTQRVEARGRDQRGRQPG
jgi:hypothetical protein